MSIPGGHSMILANCRFLVGQSLSGEVFLHWRFRIVLSAGIAERKTFYKKLSELQVFCKFARSVVWSSNMRRFIPHLVVVLRGEARKLTEPAEVLIRSTNPLKSLDERQDLPVHILVSHVSKRSKLEHSFLVWRQASKWQPCGIIRSFEFHRLKYIFYRGFRSTARLLTKCWVKQSATNFSRGSCGRSRSWYLLQWNLIYDAKYGKLDIPIRTCRCRWNTYPRN